jgi:hypothetical protein
VNSRAFVFHLLAYILSAAHDISTEARYRLVHLDCNPNAQSDALITLPFPEIADELQTLQLSYTDHTLTDHLYWSANGSQDRFSIIVFPGEFKTNDAAYNVNQLIMVLTTALSQRKALSLENSVIMGATCCYMDVFRFILRIGIGRMNR